MSTAQSQIGSFQVLREIGRGGMGVVYLARDTRLDRQVAIKALPEDFAADPERLTRFEREAKTLASLSHPNVGGIYGVEEHEGKRFLILEFVEGQTLAEHLESGPLPIDETLELCTQVAAGLEAAHEAGVIHRDLKPGNIKITPEGKVKVLDFGLAKSAARPGSSSSLLRDSPTMSLPATPHSPTIPGAIMGTAPYMSPEQARGRSVDKRSDIWSFGVILYECLTGLSPFTGETVSDSIGAILHKDPDIALLPAPTPPRIVDLLRRMLEKNRDQRLRDAGDARLILDECLRSREWLAQPGARARRTRWVGVGSAVVTGALMLVLGFLIGRQWNASAAGGSRPALVAGAFTKLTDADGSEGWPRLSPDGSTLVYCASGPDGSQDIWSLRVGGFNPVNLTPGSPGDDTAPAFSPDGQRIAFRSERDGGGLWVMGATGESPRRITSVGFDPAWSPDGRQIVFTDEGIIHPYVRNRDTRLFVVAPDGGEVRTVYGSDAVQPAWSPGGHRIAFWTIVAGGQRDIFTIPSGGGEPVAVTADAATDWCPVWSPDGRFLYFCSDRGGHMNLWRVPIDERTGQRRGDFEPVTAGVGDLIGLPSISRDGRRIAYCSIQMIVNVQRLKIDLQTGLAIGHAEWVTRGTTSIFYISASPNGEWLAATRAGATEDLVILRSDGSDRRLLTNDAAKDRGPSWSSDGQRIAFYSDRSERYEIWTIRADGSGLTQVTQQDASAPRTTTFPYWSPDDRRIVYSHGEDGRIAELLPSGVAGAVREIPRPSEQSTLSLRAWSPDGSMIGAAIQQDVKPRTCVLDAETGKVVRVFDRGGEYCDWLDNKRLLTIDDSAVLLLDLESGEVREIYSAGRDVIAGSPMDYCPATGWLYFPRANAQADVWMIELE